MPVVGRHVWEWFVTLHAARGSNGSGPNPIGFEEIKSWSELNRMRLRPWEVETIRRIDAAYIKVSEQNGD